MTVGQVIAKLGVDPKEYEKGLKKAEAQADKAGSRIGSIFKNAFSVTLGMGMFEALKKGIKSVVGASIDFNSMIQTAQIGFATMLGSAEKAQMFLDDMADFAVKTPFEYPELLEAAKRMLAYGFAAEEVLPTLRAVGDAAAALGSGSVGIDRITLALGQIRAKGKLSGEEMRQLTEAGIPAWHMLAEAMGTTVPELQKMVSKGLIPGAKAVEMLTAGMEKRFGGMMASMENTWQGVTSSIKDIWRMTVGALTQNLFGGLNAMLIKVRDFMAAFYSYLQGILGKKAKQTTDGLVESTKAQAAAITEVGDASEEAAKKANKNLQAFDEVHQLQEDTGGSAAGGVFVMPETGAVAPLGMEDAGESETFTKMQETLERLKVLFNPVVEGFNRLKEAAGPIIQNIGEGLKWFYENVLVPFGKWVISEALPAWLNMFAASLSTLNPIIDAFKPLASWLWENFLKPIASWVGDAYITWLNMLADAYKGIGDWMSEHKGVIEAIAIVVGSFAAAWGLVNLAIGIWNVIGAIATGVTSAFGAAVAFLTSPIGIAVVVIGSLITIGILLYKNWDAVKEWLITTWNNIKDAAVSVWTAIADFFTELWNGIKDIAVSVWTAIGEFFSGLWNGIRDTAISVWNGIKEFFSTLWEWLKSFFSQWGPLILAIIAPFMGVPLLIIQNWGKIKEFLSNLWNDITKLLAQTWQDIKDTATEYWDNLVKSAFNWGKNLIGNIIDGIKSMINRVRETVSNVANTIKGYLGFSSPTEEGPGRDADKWAPNFMEMYRKGLTRGIPNIRSSVNAIADEMASLTTMSVKPSIQALATTVDFGENLTDVIASAIGSAVLVTSPFRQSPQQTQGDIVIQIDGTTLARVLNPYIDKESRRIGGTMIVET